MLRFIEIHFDLRRKSNFIDILQNSICRMIFSFMWEIVTYKTAQVGGAKSLRQYGI